MQRPIIYATAETPSFLSELETSIQDKIDKKSSLLLDYPTVYIHYWQRKHNNADKKYDIYIGETNNILERTKQHMDARYDAKNWQNHLLNDGDVPTLMVIGHDHFNKSMTLDVENRMIQYALGMDTVDTVHNARGNPQSHYYPDEELDEIFSMIWRGLRKNQPKLFPTESAIRDSAIFKASPFHKLTEEQIKAKNLIIDKVINSVSQGEGKQLIFVEGEAGTGKTVLTNSTFYELINEHHLKCHLLVNHDEQVSVYQEIARKLQVPDHDIVVSRPTTFINNHSPEDKIDVAFVDEAHLLWTQGKQSYRGMNQLEDIMDRAKVTVIMFDENQILTTEEYWAPEEIESKREFSKSQGNYLTLKNQMRMTAGPDVINWIDTITKEHKVIDLGPDTEGYDIKVFDSPNLLAKAIAEKEKKEESALSRLIASYDWDYSSAHKPDSEDYWEVKITNSDGTLFHMPWNRELEKTLGRKEKRAIHKLAWAEQPQTTEEIGSTFTIQGFDLVYSGVIIGPSVKFREGKVVFDPSESKNSKAKQNRTLADNSKKKFGEYLLSHELRVLLTRGVKGMYIYACDDELREALKKSIAK